MEATSKRLDVLTERHPVVGNAPAGRSRGPQPPLSPEEAARASSDPEMPSGLNDAEAQLWVFRRSEEFR